MSQSKCYFGVQLNTQCHKLEFCRTTGIVNLTNTEKVIQETFLWRAGLLIHEGEQLTICIHRENVFGSVFEQRNKNYCKVYTFITSAKNTG